MPEPEKEQKPIPYYYANVAKISHSPYEFIIDLGITMPEAPNKAMATARVVMSPPHIKALLKAIGDNIIKYEDRFGRISFPPALDDIGKFLGQFGLKEVKCPKCGHSIV